MSLFEDLCELLDSVLGAVFLIIMGGVFDGAIWYMITNTPSEPSVANLLYLIPTIFELAGIIDLVTILRN